MNTVKVKKVIVSEDVESEWLAQDLLLWQRQGKIMLYTHIYHELHTSSWYGRRKKTRLGVTKGFPDYVVVTENEVIFIELKRTKNSTTSPEQKMWIAGLSDKQTVAVICKGYLEAKRFLEERI